MTGLWVQPSGSANHGFKSDEEGDTPKFKDTYTGLRAGTFINDNIRVYANLGQVKGTDKDSDGPVNLTGKIKNQGTEHFRRLCGQPVTA